MPECQPGECKYISVSLLGLCSCIASLSIMISVSVTMSQVSSNLGMIDTQTLL